jgi:hypothetical protein
MTSTPRLPSRDLDRQRQQLETLVQAPSPRWTIPHSLKQLGDRTMRFFTGQPEPRVWQRTRHGQLTWFAHDPVTNRTRQFSSEQEVRLWLEKRYYE